MHLFDNVIATLLINAKAKTQKASKKTFFNIKELQQKGGKQALTPWINWTKDVKSDWQTHLKSTKS